jgi:adenylate cyclase
MAEERLQRRLAAIMSADMVDYSRLMGMDEAGTLSRLNALRRELIDPAIASHWAVSSSSWATVRW